MSKLTLLGATHVELNGTRFELILDRPGALLHGSALPPVPGFQAWLELEQNGFYTFTVDGTDATGNYTLGLAEIAAPAAIDITVPLEDNLLTLGNRQYFVCDGAVGDILELTLNLPTKKAPAVRGPWLLPSGVIQPMA